MRMIKIDPFENGAHNNQTYNDFLPDGYAVIPDDLDTPNYPFGEVTVEVISNLPTVTKWTALPIPYPDPVPVPVPPIDERVSALEQQLADADETAISLYEAQAEQEEIIARQDEINAQQDEALLEIYEMLGM